MIQEPHFSVFYGMLSPCLCLVYPCMWRRRTLLYLPPFFFFFFFFGSFYSTTLSQMTDGCICCSAGIFIPRCFVDCSIYGILSTLTASFGYNSYFERSNHLFDQFPTTLSIVLSFLFFIFL
jgi:hypothetical protein